MKKHFGKLLLILSCSFLIFGCSSSGGISIPGESALVRKNLVNEYMNIARAYEDLKKYDKAVEYYQMAINLDSNKILGSAAHYNIGHCYALAGDWENASISYTDLLKSDPENTNLKISLAYLKAMSGDLDGACDDYKTLCQENPTNVSLLKNYISVLLAAKKYEEVEENMEVMKEKFPADTAIAEMTKAIEESKKSEEESTEENEESEESVEAEGER